MLLPARRRGTRPLAATTLALRGAERPPVTRSVADPGLGAGVQREPVAGLPALEVAGRGLELLGAGVGGGAQLELGAALLPVRVGADPPAQQAHRLQGVEAPADGAVMAIAILEPVVGAGH